MGMNTPEAVRHPRFGTQVRLAQALGITQPTVASWGGRPPALHQLRIEAMTNGDLRADEAAVAEYPDLASFIRGVLEKQGTNICQAAAVAAPEDGYRDPGAPDGPPPCDEAAREPAA